MKNFFFIRVLWKMYVYVSRWLYKLMDRRTYNMLGEFSEHLVAAALGGSLELPSNTAYDITLSNGKTIQVKSRKIRENNKYTPTLSDIYSWHFDWLIIVLFKEDGSLKQVLKIDAKTVQTSFAKKRSTGSGAYVVRLSKKFIDATDDITKQFLKYNI